MWINLFNHNYHQVHKSLRLEINEASKKFQKRYQYQTPGMNNGADDHSTDVASSDRLIVSTSSIELGGKLESYSESDLTDSIDRVRLHYFGCAKCRHVDSTPSPPLGR